MLVVTELAAAGLCLCWWGEGGRCMMDVLMSLVDGGGRGLDNTPVYLPLVV